MKKRNTLILHSLGGIAFFYFIIHPLTMVIYWYEFTGTSISLSGFGEAFWQRLTHSFMPEMAGMAFTFIAIGLLAGLGSGFYYSLLSKKQRIVSYQEKLLERNVRTLVNEGENSRIEFKSSLNYDFERKQPYSALEMVFAKTVAGFMNASGGYLLLGVSDDKAILGLQENYDIVKHKNRDGFELKMHQILTGKLGAHFSPYVHTSFHTIDGKDVCLVEIEKSPTPVFVRDKDGKPQYFLRTGNGTRPLNVQEVVGHINNLKKVQTNGYG